MAVQGTHGHSLLTMDMGWLNPKINDLCPKAVNTHERREVFECYLLSLLVESDTDAPKVYFSLSPFCHQCLCLITICVLNS